MSINNTVRRRGLAAVAAVIATLALGAPNPADARVSTGAAVGIGLGSLALGTALGSGAYGRPWGGGGYYPYGYGGYYAPAPTYYAPPPPPAYSYPRTCWYPQYGGYYAC